MTTEAEYRELCDSLRYRPIGTTAKQMREAAAAIESLLAERDALQARVTELDAALSDVASPDFMRKYDALLRELAECRRDAERYRWLTSRAKQNTSYDVYGNGGHWCLGFHSTDSRLSFTDAIDAAMERETA